MRLRVGVALLLVLAALGAVNYLRPIPAVTPTHLLRTSDVVPGTAPSLPWPSRGSAAVGVSGLGLLAGSGNEQAIPAASVTKVMTVLVILADKPLKTGEPGPSVTLSGIGPDRADRLQLDARHGRRDGPAQNRAHCDQKYGCPYPHSCLQLSCLP